MLLSRKAILRKPSKYKGRVEVGAGAGVKFDADDAGFDAAQTKLDGTGKGGGR